MGADKEYLSSDSDVEETLEDDEGGDFEFSDDDLDIPDDVDETLYDDECGDFEGSDDDSDGLVDDRGEEAYTVLTEEDIGKRQEEDIAQVFAGLSIARESATILLRHYNWEVNKALDSWFADEEKVRKDVGLLEEQVVPIQDTENVIECRSCFDVFPRDGMCATACGHLFCKLCWTKYVSIKIDDGPGCLMMRCPEPSCAAAVGQDMVNELVSEKHKEKYSRYLLRSYVEDQKKMKWCPGPGCEYAVAFVAGSSSYDVICSSDHSFCWNCLDDAHRPVDCDTVGKWALMNTNESENITWIFANSKSCPKCKVPIQKNEGCMHMTCSCKFEFCWLCLGDWSTHAEATGGYFACNIYEKAKAEGAYDEEEKTKQEAKDFLDRYAFFYERFVENQKSRLKAIESLKKMLSEDLAMLIDRYALSEMELGVITDAWRQIIECRRVLKWTYAYGYYLPESEHAKKNLFDHLQGEAESGLERLHQCAEQEIKIYLKEDDSDDADQGFKVFHTKLFGLTKVTGNYFGNLVRALENGLSDVNSR
ncbi:hypothetical protein MKX03_022050 [Papaver bracteatum]|nr:hypothetical protein MKX03_022050 [Papaver bracteatum]